MFYSGSLGLMPLGYVEPGQNPVAAASFPVSVTTAWTGAASGAQVRNVSGAVTATFTAAASDSAHKITSGTVTTAFTTFAQGSSAKNAEHPVSATVAWQVTASATKNRVIVASVTTALSTASSPGEHSARNVAVTAVSGWAASTSERVAGIHAVTAQSSSQWSATTMVHIPGSSQVTARATVYVTALVSGALYPPHLNTTTAFAIADAYFAQVIGAKHVTVQDGGFKAKATTSEHNLAVFRETATAPFEVRTLTTVNVVAPRTAGAAAVFVTSTAATRALPRTVAAGATWGAHASTTNLKRVTATSSAVLASLTHASIGGQEVDAGSVLFRAITRSTVWLPWRQDSLTLPPAGNLPHST